VRELLRALAVVDSPHRFLLYAREPWEPEALDERFSWRVITARDPLWNLRAAIAANRACDVFLSTNSYLTAWALTVPSVIVVFDTIAFNQEFRPQRRAAAIERVTLRPAVRRAAGIAAISHSTRDDLVSRYPRAQTKTVVTQLAASGAFSPEGKRDAEVLTRHAVEHPYVLATGTLEPRKNLPRLIEAFTSLPEPHRLVLIGPTGWEADETFDSIAAHRNRVTTLGYVSDDDLPALYRQAELFAYPSLYEGFGLPVLEAMQSGTAVVASDRPSIVEVGADAVRYADPLSVPGIAAALIDVLGDPNRRADLAARGLKRADGFSWRTTAEETLALLERVAR
jgi:alpha-1,3-rhamnosyl/mannosyltransferase